MDHTCIFDVGHGDVKMHCSAVPGLDVLGMPYQNAYY